jgi:hypothetical protein
LLFFGFFPTSNVGEKRRLGVGSSAPFATNRATIHALDDVQTFHAHLRIVSISGVGSISVHMVPPMFAEKWKRQPSQNHIKHQHQEYLELPMTGTSQQLTEVFHVVSPLLESLHSAVTESDRPPPIDPPFPI